jgi:FAD/FMN-containing dehydrogenase
MARTVAVDSLRSSMKGTALTPGDDGYDDARRIWNADIDRRPAVIAQCETAEDVSAAVRFGVEHDLEIAVRGGAHSVSGKSTVDDGLVIDLSKMDSAVVDPQVRRVRCGGGALLGPVIAAAQEHGLAYPVGAIGHTGVGGLTLGGGQGWLTRKHGMSIDNLLSAEVVLADGSIVRADANNHADLFWALRGGGGNFGVVTEFEFQLHPVGPMVQLAMLFYTLDQGREFLQAIRDISTSMPAETNLIFGGLNAPPEPFVPQEHQLKPGWMAAIVGFGSEAEHAGVVARLRDAVTPLFEMATPIPYAALQTMLDEANAWGFYNYEKGCSIPELSDAVIDVLAEAMPKKVSPLSATLIYRLDGAYCDVAEDATAYSGTRTPQYGVFTFATCPTPELLDVDRAWVRDMIDALKPYSLDTTYINAVHELDDEEARSLYGAKYERLVQIKQKYDPTNVFRRNDATFGPGAAIPGQRTVDVTQPVSAPAGE